MKTLSNYLILKILTIFHVFPYYIATSLLFSIVVLVCRTVPNIYSSKPTLSFFSGHTSGMCKFPDHRCNLHHSSDPGCCSDNARYLTCCTIREFQYIFFFIGPHLQHMEVLWLGVKSQLQLPAYATATSMQDPSSVCDLHHSSPQRRILKPQSGARD